jgi:4'-phosphopantetheinyl transferase
MNKSLTQFIENHIKSMPVQNEHRINIWYCEIQSIINVLFDMEKHPAYAENYNIIRNRTIDKNDFLIPFLSDSELETLNKFKSFKKQIEWFSGRFLLKNCLSLLINDVDDLQNILVAYEKEGAPFLPGFPHIKISLSHSGNMAVLGVCVKQDVDIGIDIEQFRKKPDENFLKAAFTQNEIINMDDTVESILRNWTAKEAFLKYIKKGFNESLHKVEIIDNRVFHNKQEMRVSLFSEIIDNDYVLSMVTDKSKR